jgi:hypothetical protein
MSLLKDLTYDKNVTERMLQVFFSTKFRLNLLRKEMRILEIPNSFANRSHQSSFKWKSLQTMFEILESMCEDGDLLLLGTSVSRHLLRGSW